ncbi:MAG: hypothetical protein HYR85_17685 [Planctomycetes bacterium]|nr:hypothetical protein [Planctomycetota bacterium]
MRHDITPTAGFVVLLLSASTVRAQTPPPAPVVSEPAAGASLVQPITLKWGAVVDPDGPIGSYTWQVGTSSTFGTVIASGFTNVNPDAIPAATQDAVSGLPNGTYFLRVKATQIVGGVVFSLDSAWSPVLSFTVIGLGAAPGTPSFASPATGSSFHVREFFQIRWSAVPNAHHYLLEVDDEPSFSYPLTLTTDLIQFGTVFQAGWGNAIPDIYYRVRAVSADNVRSLPSPTLNIHVTNAAPVPPPPTPLSPTGGATITVPFTFDWTDTANPQIPGYDLDIDNEPNFLGTTGVLFFQGVSRSDYMVVSDPLVEHLNHLPPGTYFWRVRAIHGDVVGSWSAGASFTVVASPPTPPGLALFSIIAEPGSVNGGNSTQARVTLNGPAPAGGALVKIASDLPHAQTPTSVLIPAGATDATISPITTVPVRGATIGNIRAAYADGWQQSSLGLFPLLWGLSLSNDAVVGGTLVTGTITLLNPAPPSGVVVTLISGDTSLATLPPSVFIPAGATSGTFDVTTAPVSIATRVVIDSGTGFEGYRAPSNWMTLLPPGSPAPPPSLSSLTLATGRVFGSGSTTGTVVLTSPAPAGGATVRLSASMEGQVVAPQSVTVAAGAIAADFPITAPQVNAPHWVLVQGSYGVMGSTQAQLLEVDPGVPGAATLLAIGVTPLDVIGGASTRGTIELVMPAPSGGGVVTLTSDDPSIVQVPSSISVSAGNSAGSFTITTSPVLMATGTRVNASAGGVTRSAFINVAPDPNAPPGLLSVTLSVSGVTGGNNVNGTLFLSANAPAGGTSVTLSTSNASVARVPPIVLVPGGLGFASFTVTTFPVSTSTPVTITGFFGNSTQSANLTVMPSPSPPPIPSAPTLLSPANSSRPAQPVTLDWNDVANAATYLVQVDDSSAFSTPLVRSQTVTASQFTTSGLAARTQWWRVRGVNSVGGVGPWSAVRHFQPQAQPATPTLSSLALSPTSVAGGTASRGTVTLTGVAPSGGAVVSLSSSNASLAGVPPSVTVLAGATTATFSVTTAATTSSTFVTLTGSNGGVTRTSTITVTPPAAPASVQSVTVSPSNTTGGASAQGTVTLTIAAPSGGAVVALSSSNASVATVPASVTVLAGSSTATFSVPTTVVAASVSVTISAAFGGANASSTLTVVPEPSGPLPAPSLASPANDARFSTGQSITFDWSDVSAAAGYTIEIDDSQGFSAPLVLSRTLVPSQLATSTLPTTRMWWRVRANDASGSPGAWSAALRFEVR